MNLDITIAFAGVLQASELVRQLASSGTCSQQAAAASLASIFNRDPSSTEDVYGGVGGVRMGLRVLVELFSSGSDRDTMQSLHYSLGLIKLANQVTRDRERQHQLGRDIELIEAAREQSDNVLDATVIAQLGDAYEQHISTLDFRLSISGKPEYLQQRGKVANIRALLLAGIRSAFLWRQLGGRPWRLVFQRRKMLYHAQSLLTA